MIYKLSWIICSYVYMYLIIQRCTCFVIKMYIVIKYWYEDRFGIIVVVKSRLPEIDSSLGELDEEQLSGRFTHPFAKTYVS